MNKLKLAICAVLPSAWRSTEQFVEGFIVDLFMESEKFVDVETIIVLAIETSGREGWHILETLPKRFPNLYILPYLTNTTSSAILYLSSFQKALDLNADFVLEIDCSGGHEASEVVPFLIDSITSLKQDPKKLLCTLSTRFGVGGADYFPQDRVLLSKAGTTFGRYFLGLGHLGRPLTDLTSGFEAFSASLLKEMFRILPSARWVSMWWGPMHLFQTEIRALVCWIGNKIPVELYQRPITFGAKFDRKLAPLTLSYLSKAFIGGLLLVVERFKFDFLQSK